MNHSGIMDAYRFNGALCCEACAEAAKARISSGPQSLQRLGAHGVINLTREGRLVARAAKDMVEASTVAIDAGFQDGGCLAFADALADWSDGAIVACAVEATDRPGVAQHYVGRFGRLYVDSDGIGTAADVVAKMEAFCPAKQKYVVVDEPSADPAHIRPDDPAQIPRDKALSSSVADALRTTLKFDPVAMAKLGRPSFDRDDARTFDPSFFPSGPFPDGGGEDDHPNQCEECGVFLENPLTLVGEKMVFRAVSAGHGLPDVLEIWRSHYGHLFPEPELEEEVEPSFVR